MVLSVEVSENPDSVAGLEFYSGILAPVFTEIILPEITETPITEAGLALNAAGYLLSKKHSLGTNFIGIPEHTTGLHTVYGSDYYEISPEGNRDKHNFNIIGTRSDIPGLSRLPVFHSKAKRALFSGKLPYVDSLTAIGEDMELFRCLNKVSVENYGQADIVNDRNNSVTALFILSAIDEYLIETLRLIRNIPAADILTWATINNARALGIDHVAGSFEAGKYPGAILIDGIDWENRTFSDNTTSRRIM